jgi:hypothetical protein
MMMLYVAVAAGRFVGASLPLIDPALVTAHFQCDTRGCRIETSPHRLFTGSDRDVAALPRERRARLEEWLRQPQVKLWLFVGEVIRALPSIALFLSLAVASRELSRSIGFTQTLRWLRRAAAAAVAVAFAEPIADTVRASTMSPIETGTQQVHLAFNGGPFLWGVLLAGAVWMSVWALEQARLTEIELGTIV